MAIYYVDQSIGIDTNPGTEGQPWRTIQKAANTMVAGDTTYVKNGTYAERVEPANSGTAANYIAYRNYTGHFPTINASGLTAGIKNGSAAAGSGRDYLIFDGFEIRTAGDAGIVLHGGATYNRILNCVIRDCVIGTGDGHGIRIFGNAYGTSHIYIDNCTIYNNDGHGILFYSGGDHSEVYNCRIYENGVTPGVTYASGIEINDTDDVTVQYCDIYDNCMHGIDVCGGANETRNCWIDQNDIHENACCGVGLDNGVFDNLISRNRIYGNGTAGGWGSGIQVWATIADYPADNQIYNNTIFANRSATASGGGIMFEDAGITGHAVRNNIIFANTPYDYFVAADSNINGGSNYNCFAGTNNIRYVGVTYSLAGYQAVSGRDGRSIDDYPMCCNEDFAEFHLRPGSPCIDAGVDIGLPHSGAAPDMGAYEFEYQDVGVYDDDDHLQGRWLFEEAAGTRYDETENDNNLTDYNTVGQGATEYKEGIGCADFEATNSERLAISDAVQTGLDVTGSLTLAAWVRMESLGDGVIVSKWNSTGNQRSYCLRVVSSAPSYPIYASLSNDGTSYTEAISATSIIAGLWYHVAMVYNGTDVRIYVNGVLDSNGANNPKTYGAGIYNSTAEFAFGARNASTLYFDGLIDEGIIFDRALSADEIYALYRDGIRVGAPFTPVTEEINYLTAGYWPLGYWMLDYWPEVGAAGEFTIRVKDSPVGHVALFSAGDILRMKAFNGSVILDNWLEVQSVTDPGIQYNYFQYSVTRVSGSPGTFPAGTAIVNYGQAGSGFIKLTSDDAYSPFIDIATHQGEPWDSITPHIRLGNLDGVLALDEQWGLAAGEDLSDDTKPHAIFSSDRVIIRSSAVGPRVEIRSEGIGIFAATGETGVARLLGGLVNTTTKVLDPASSDLGWFGYDASNVLQVAWYGSGTNAGKVMAGAGVAWLDQGGVGVAVHDSSAYVKFFSGANEWAQIRCLSSSRELQITANSAGESEVGRAALRARYSTAMLTFNVASTATGMEARLWPYDGTFNGFKVGANSAPDYTLDVYGTGGISGDLRLGAGLAVGSQSLDPHTGTIAVQEISSTPSDPASGTQMNIYMRGNRLIVQFNDGGTVRYKYLDLSGTGVTWVHTTTAPT